MGTEAFDVVVVDDADDVRAVVKTQLRLSGRFRVVGEGRTGRDAIDLSRWLQPAAVILDASMPDIDGLTATPEILAASPNTRIVMFSGFDGESLREAALALGVADYVEKSTPIAELSARVLATLIDTDDQAAPLDAEHADVLNRGADAAFARHLERFRTVFDQAAIGMATLTLSGTVVRANDALAGLVGQTRQSLVGASFGVVAADEDRDALDTAIREASLRFTVQELEHRVPGSGSLRWVRSAIAAVRDENGTALYLFAQLQDVTAQHAAAERLRQSEERFRLMVESVQDYAIFMLDTSGHVTTWNLGAERLKGYSADEIIGQHFRTFYPEEPRARRHPEHELEIAVREGRYEEEGWRVRKDGSQFWANVVITALFDRDGKHIGFAKVTRDMTERRAAETARELAAADLAASNRELHDAAKQTEEFLAVTAHELQSPITAINGSADILAEHWDQLDPDERLQTVRRITDGGRRIRRLLDDLLTASRIEAGMFAVDVRPVALAEVIDRALLEVASAEAANVAGATDVVVRADPTRLVQILTNLLSNALKYGRPPYGIVVRRTPGAAEIRITDSGDGPPSEVTPRLFEKFAKSSQRQQHGTGLGLFIVRELARMQGGDAWYEPGPAFVVRLPIDTPTGEDDRSR